MIIKIKKKIKNYILNREKSGTIWKLSTMIITLIILTSLYSKGIIAIATINNKPVTISELVIFLRRNDSNNIIDKAITERIIELEARKRNIEVTTEETQTEIKRLSRIAAENGKTVYELMQTAEDDSKELEKNVKTRMTLYKIMSSGEPISDEQIDHYVEENRDLINPEEEEIIKTELKYMLLNDKIIEDYDSWIRDAHAETDIDYFIDLDNI